MPQVDLETLTSVCGVVGPSSDRKVASVNDEPDLVPPRPSDNDPPDSFWLSKDAELDWFDRNAVVLDRQDSAKAANNSNSSTTPSHHSQRIPPNLKKSKASILALPKPMNSRSDTAKKHRRRPNLTSVTLFPKRSAKADQEPSSPKVSCMGRVRSKRDKNRQQLQQTESCSRSKSETRLEKCESEKRKRIGFWKRCLSIFRSKSSERRKSSGGAASNAAGGVVEPIGLGGMKRFVSGRRSDSWVGDLDRKHEPVVGPHPTASGRRSDSWIGDLDQKHESVVEPVGLGGMKQFASGRRSDSWVGDLNQKIEPVVEPVGLGGMKRFVSGRRSDSWIGDLDQKHKPVVEPFGLGGMKQFVSGRRSDSWVEDLDRKTEPVGLGGMKRFVSGRRSDSWIGDLESEKKPVKGADEDCGPVREVGSLKEL